MILRVTYDAIFRSDASDFDDHEYYDAMHVVIVPWSSPIWSLNVAAYSYI